MLHSTSEYLGHCESWHKHAACNAGLCGAPMCGNATQRDSHAGRLRAGQTSKRECAATGRPRRTGPYPCGSLLTVPVHEIRPCACPGLFRQHEICPCACPGLFRQHSLLDYQNQTLCSPPPPPQPLPPPLSQRLRELKPDALLVLGLPLSGTGISDSCGCVLSHALGAPLLDMYYGPSQLPIAVPQARGQMRSTALHCCSTHAVMPLPLSI
jgi:hypothetical protein